MHKQQRLMDSLFYSQLKALFKLSKDIQTNCTCHTAYVGAMPQTVVTLAAVKTLDDHASAAEEVV